jgi:hypothetical protein
MSTAHLAFRCCAAIATLALTSLPAAALELKSYKDALFAYPSVLAEEDGGAFVTVDYQEMRDINGRDEIPERRAKGKYVSLAAKRQQAFETISASGRSIDVLRVGTLANAKFAVIFIHGRGGDRKLGANDFSFGGNFNRLKNLAVQNEGVYYAPSVKSFDTDGAADIAALIDHIASISPQAKIVLSCASMGSFVCWGVTRDAHAVGQLTGMMVMGGATDPDFSKSAAYRAKLPMFFSQGSHDSVYAAADQIKLYKALITAQYPTRFVLFQSGSHGTPVRMTDWRDSLDWIFAKRP